MQNATFPPDNRPMVDRAEMVDAATRLLGEQELALYLDVDAAQLRRYITGVDEVPQLVTLRVVDRLLAESAHPASTLEAMAKVLEELKPGSERSAATG
jgi:hypothetical protein